MSDWIKRSWYWRMAVLRVFFYGYMCVWPVFKQGTNGYQSLGQMTQIDLIYLFGDMSQAFCGVIIAFIDNSMNVLRNGKGRYTPEELKAIAAETS